MKFDLNGKVALVTGYSGIPGPLWCKALLEVGAKVMASDITGCRENSEITDLSKNYGHKKYRQFSADVLNRDELEEMCQVTEHYLGAVSILVNNAGMDTPPKPGKSYAIEDIPQGDSLPVINVNFYGVFLVSQVLGAIMLKRSQGSIINIGNSYTTFDNNSKVFSFFDAISKY